jgi:hypothetical protein
MIRNGRKALKIASPHKRFNFAFLGRLLSPQKDNLSLHYALIGRSHTGKSLIADAITQTHMPHNVRSFSSSNKNNKKALHPALQPYLWQMEVGQGTSPMSADEWIAWVDGKKVPNPDPSPIDSFATPGFTEGASLPPNWLRDERIIRRLILNIFDVPVDVHDSTLKESLANEMPHLLPLLTHAASAMSRFMSQRGIKDIRQFWPDCYNEPLKRCLPSGPAPFPQPSSPPRRSNIPFEHLIESAKEEIFQRCGRSRFPQYPREVEHFEKLNDQKQIKDYCKRFIEYDFKWAQILLEVQRKSNTQILRRPDFHAMKIMSLHCFNFLAKHDASDIDFLREKKDWISSVSDRDFP